MEAKGFIFNIQRFSIHDGPGIRTTAFLKGCSMRCFWCHNPEGRNPYLELQYFPARCIACGECVAACPNHAHEMRDGVHYFLRDKCRMSGRCVDTCYALALELSGKEMTVSQVMEEILRDRAFYENSGGGVTLSGGEPVLHTDFSLQILKRCRDEGFHTAIETCGQYQWEKLLRLIPVTDMVMMDLKHMDTEKHRQGTGHYNELILNNARRLALTDKPIIFRTPVIPGFNDTEAEIGEIAAFIRDLYEIRVKYGKMEEEDAGIRYELLPFHQMAGDKYRSLDMEYRAKDLKPPDKSRMEELKNILIAHGISSD
ncbi:MAG: glycyl-radical enzyme activating protein [candidate division KSB1 bacterium]|jgi:pyruvate formate lyase activating enzyme|nr:glycyl-radical enzyme activating protein [candidate division KSB1 bacterium]